VSVGTWTTVKIGSTQLKTELSSAASPGSEKNTKRTDTVKEATVVAGTALAMALILHIPGSVWCASNATTPLSGGICNIPAT